MSDFDRVQRLKETIQRKDKQIADLRRQDEGLIELLVRAQLMAGEQKLYKAMHAIDEAKNVAGWELGSRETRKKA